METFSENQRKNHQHPFHTVSAFSFNNYVFGQIERVTNAGYFNNFIKLRTDLSFNIAIPDNMVRLVTEELAISIARRHMSEFGSNTQVLGCHITKIPEGEGGLRSLVQPMS